MRATHRARPPRVVMVIGASSGIGLATARQFAARGDHLVLASRSAARLADAGEQCYADGATSAIEVPTDTGSEADIDLLFARALDQHGAVDVVVHTATVMAYGGVTDLPTDVFTTVVDTAIRGTFYTARAALRAFTPTQRGNLIFVNSLLGFIAAPQMSAYVTAKWGQAGLIRSLQIEARQYPNIHISSVSPGGVNTPIYSQAANVTGRSAAPPIPVDPPDKVARAIVRCVEHPRPRVSVGLANHFLVFGFRAFAPIYDRLVTPLLHFASLTPPATQPADGNVFTPDETGEAERGEWPHRWRLPAR